jgi:hypothetical protein
MGHTFVRLNSRNCSTQSSSIYLEILIIIRGIDLYCLCIVEKGCIFQTVLSSTFHIEIEFVNSKLTVHVDSKLFSFLLLPSPVVEVTMDFYT